MKKTIALLLTILICVIMIAPTFVNATNEIDPNGFDLYKGAKGENEKIVTAGQKILGIAQVIGIACGVVCLIVLGIKYMLMSTDANDKASIKEKLIPYVIGAVLLFGGSGLLGIIARMSNSISTK